MFFIEILLLSMKRDGMTIENMTEIGQTNKLLEVFLRKVNKVQ